MAEEQEGPGAEEQAAEEQAAANSVAPEERELVAKALKELGQVVFINLAHPAPRALLVLEIEVAAGRVVDAGIIVKNKIYHREES